MRTAKTPMWSEHRPGVSGDHSGMWPLGLEPLGGALVGYLMPGLNNAVRHVRYYSFYCWAFWEYEQWRTAKGLPYRRSQQADRLERLEAALRAASLHHAPQMPGVVGVNSYLPLPPDPSQPFPISESQAPSGFVPAAYSASWRNLQCGEIGEKGRVKLTEQFGVPLAKAFRARLERRSASDLRRLLSDEPSIPAAVIHSLGEGLRLGPVPQHEAEHHLLSELLVRLEHRGIAGDWERSHRSRRRSIGLLLDLLQESGGLDDPGDLYHVWASSHLPNGRQLLPSAQYEEQFQSWQRYQERQCEKMAMYGIWHSAIQYLRSAGGYAPTDAIVGDVLLLARHSETATRWLGPSWLERSVADVRAAVQGEMSQRGDQAACALPELWSAVRSPEREAERVGSAVVLLLATCHTWEERKKGLPERQTRWHHDSDFSRLPLDHICEDLERHSSVTTKDWMVRFVERHILSQAVLVAIGKRDEDNNFRFFVAPDEEGFRLVKDPGNNLYFDPPRIENMLSLLEGLGYVVVEEQGVTITDAGRGLLQRLAEHGDGAGASLGGESHHTVVG